MRFTVLIPAKNEAATLPRLLERVLRQLQGRDAEVIVIDDGSNDGTAAVAAAVTGVRVLSHSPSAGKGAALKRGLEAATGEVVLVQDADLEYFPEDYPRLFAPFVEEQAQVVYGSRILGKRAGVVTQISSPAFYWGGLFLSGLTNLLYGARMTDVSTGYKVFRTALLRSLDLERPGFQFCPEVTGKLLKMKVPIRELPISYAPRTVAQGKKIRWTDGIAAIWTLFAVRLFWQPPAR